jgi:hypothetical protein
MHPVSRLFHVPLQTLCCRLLLVCSTLCCIVLSEGCQCAPPLAPALPGELSGDTTIAPENFARTVNGGDPRGTYTPNTPLQILSIARFFAQRRGDSVFGQIHVFPTGFPSSGVLTLIGENAGKGTYTTQDFKFGLRYSGEPKWWSGSSTFFGVFHDIFITVAVDAGVKPGDTVRQIPFRYMGVRIPSVPKQASGTWEARSNKLIFDGDTANAVSYTANAKALFFLSVFPDSLYQRAGYQATGNTILSVAFRRTN